LQVASRCLVDRLAVQSVVDPVEVKRGHTRDLGQTRQAHAVVTMVGQPLNHPFEAETVILRARGTVGRSWRTIVRARRLI
jgi:hypothetical protein